MDEQAPSGVIQTRLKTQLASRRGRLLAGLALWVVGLGILVATFAYSFLSSAVYLGVALGGLALAASLGVWVAALNGNPQINRLREELAWARDREALEGAIDRTSLAAPATGGGWWITHSPLLTAVCGALAAVVALITALIGK
jgi:hypothetical protein